VSEGIACHERFEGSFAEHRLKLDGLAGQGRTASDEIAGRIQCRGQRGDDADSLASPDGKVGHGLVDSKHGNGAERRRGLDGWAYRRAGHEDVIRAARFG